MPIHYSMYLYIDAHVYYGQLMTPLTPYIAEMGFYSLPPTIFCYPARFCWEPVVYPEEKLTKIIVEFPV